jgi:glycosyltransferase involved in cell wall biosynthesis
MPEVSIIIPTYNRSNFMLECLDSIWKQTYNNYEVIIVDDGSTDNTRDILKASIQDNRIIYFYQKNQGAARARNKGIESASGKFITFLDSDDCFLPNKLLNQIKYFEKFPDANIVHSNFYKFDQDGNNLGIRNTSFFSGDIYPSILLYWKMLIPISCVMIRTEIIKDVGYFDEKLGNFGEDLDLLARISKKYPFHHINECLVGIRVHSSNLSGDNTNFINNHLPYIEKMSLEVAGVFKRRMYSKLYLYGGLTLLGKGKNSHMKIARKNFFTSLQYWPIQIKSWGGILISFLGEFIRNQIHKIWCTLR